MKKIALAFLALVAIASCQKSKPAEEAQITPAFETERANFFANLQAPAELASQLQATAAEFNPALLSDPKSFGSYANDPVKAAANLGVYLSDLNYCVAYKQTAYTQELFDAAHELSKAIGLEQGFLEFLSTRFHENIAQNDSVKAVVIELFEKATNSLQGTDREKLVGITMAGYQIENLHLTLGILQSYPKDMLPDDARTVILVPLFQSVLSQKSTIETNYAFLKAITDPTNPDKNPNYAYYATAFEELIGLYGKLKVDEKIANNQGLELMKDEVVVELSQKVDAIRSKVVSL